jgi:hypothetical protein
MQGYQTELTVSRLQPNYHADTMAYCPPGKVVLSGGYSYRNAGCYQTECPFPRHAIGADTGSWPLWLDRQRPQQCDGNDHDQCICDLRGLYGRTVHAD